MLVRINLSLRSWLLLLVAFSILPVMAFSAWTITELTHEREESRRQGLVRRADSSAIAVQHYLDTLAATLVGISVGRAARLGERDRLHENALLALKGLPDATAITMFGPDGQIYFDTQAAVSSSGVTANERESVRSVFVTGRPSVSDLFTNRYKKTPTFAIAVPVKADEKVVYCLEITFTANSIIEALRGQKFPKDLIASVADRNMVIVAHTPNGEKLVGKMLSPSLRSAIASQPQQPFDTIGLEGIALKSAFATVPNWGWTVAVGFPDSVLIAPTREGLYRLGLGTFFAFAASTVFALLLSLHLVRQLGHIAEASAALGRGDTPTMSPSGIEEIDAVARALNLVKMRENETEAALSEVITAQRQTEADLVQARLDPLTGVANRGLFLETLAALQAETASQSTRLAVMFMDLDGLKKVNDQFGHEHGDEVLIKAAKILTAAIRGDDVVGRVGGDEFAICVVAPDGRIKKLSEQMAKRIIEATKQIGSGIGISIGIALCPSHDFKIGEMIRQADAAMYAAKKDGGNNFMFFVEDHAAAVSKAKIDMNDEV
jgi:diguanylate cyclase (GGDEF)-like protein